MEKESITQEEYLQLTGLLFLAKGYKKQLDDVEKAAMAITGDSEEFGLTGDAIWEDGSIDELLKVLNIKIDGSEKLHE